MSRGPCKFRQTELTRAFKAARKAGVAIKRYEIESDGKIVIVPGKPPDDEGGGESGGNEWDRI